MGRTATTWPKADVDAREVADRARQDARDRQEAQKFRDERLRRRISVERLEAVEHSPVTLCEGER